MEKIKIIFVFIMVFFCSYSKTKINFAEQLTVIYKNLEPLGVNVTPPGRLIVKADKGEFRYSETVADRQPLDVTVTVPFKVISGAKDPIRDSLFRSINLKLSGNLPDSGGVGGRFSLESPGVDGNPPSSMEARGFFVDNSQSIYDAPLTFVTSSTEYTGRAKIDVLFNTEKNPKLMKGVYKGVLILEATYNNVSVGG